MAANKHVRPSADVTFDGDGTTWSAAASGGAAGAHKGMPATLTRGDTYFIADGEMGTYNFNDAPSGTSTITVKKATIAEHGSSTGWDNAYGDGQATWTASGTVWDFDTEYVTLDGVSGHGYGASTYGFKVESTSWDQSAITCLGIAFSTRLCNNLTFKNIELKMPEVPGGTVAGASYGFNLQGGALDGGSWCKNLLISNVWSWGGSIPVNIVYATNCVVTHCSIENIGTAHVDNHFEAYVFSFDYEEVHVRHNSHRDARQPNWTTWIEPQAYPGKNLYIYGNDFYVRTNLAYNSYCNEGIFTCAGEVTCDGLYILNNTIWGWAGGNAGVFLDTDLTTPFSSNVAIQNNIWNNCSAAGISDPGGVATINNNEINDGGTAFVAPYAPAWNFALTAANAGLALSSPFNAAPFNLDRFGATRGADGTWDQGAIEYESGEGSPVLANNERRGGFTFSGF